MNYNWAFRLYMVITAVTSVYCFAPSMPKTEFPTTTCMQAKSGTHNDMLDRSSFFHKAKEAFFVTTTVGFGVAGGASPGSAKEVDPAVKGTKSDPKYQACLSTCLYECTKPKGTEQKSRGECIPECKQKCATSKEQLMMGTPKKE